MIRVIPRLDIKGPNVVKGVHLEGLRVLGRPELFAARYYQDGADELMYIDTVASLYGRNTLTEIVTRAAAHLYIPMTVGGGIRTLEDISHLLRAGADKVAINTAAIKNPELLREASRAFGSQCIVLYVEAKQRGQGRYECLTDNAREASGRDVFDWVREAVDLGVGEILLTSVDRDGTGKGYDLELIARVSEMVEIPVIAAGGAGNWEHVRDVVEIGRADAVCAASLFHYALIENATSTSHDDEGNREFLEGRLPLESRRRRCVTPMSVGDLMRRLRQAGVDCRVTELSARPDISQMETV
jgi:cyclase